MPPAFTVTHGILGPTMLDFGTDEQKVRHIPRMLDGRELWVQFLSEPSGGSDLAGLLTRAERDGEVFRLNGSKIWSTGAHFSDYCMVLARTNVDVPKHGGLSMFMMPIRSRGVTVTPIKLVTGGSHFCQDFFDDVQLDPSQLIGGENDGWRVASKLLFHERNMIGGNSLNDHAASGRDEAAGDAVGELAALAKAVGRNDDSYTRQLIGEAVILQTLREPTISRINVQLRTGRMPESAASILRLMAGLTGYRLREIGWRSRAPRGSCTAATTSRAPSASAGWGPASARSAAAARRCSATASASASWAAPRGHPRPRRAVQRGAGQAPPARLRKGCPLS